MAVQNSAVILAESLQLVWGQFITFIPMLLIAFVVFVIGLIIATSLSTLIRLTVKTLKVDDFLAKLGVNHYLERGGLKLDSGSFLGQAVYWLIMIAFIFTVSKILGFDTLTTFLLQILAFISKLTVAVLILIASIAIANFLKKVVKASMMSAKLHASHFLGSLTWWSIVIFGILAALEQIGLDKNSVIISVVMSAFNGLVNAFTLAAGIAFGLGGKDHVAHLLERFKNQVGK